MDDFISDEEMEKRTASSDSDFISDEEMKSYEDQNLKNAAQSGLEHFGNAASFGYLPQLQAVTEKPMAKVLDAITGNKVADSLPDYVDRRDENIARLKQEEKDHPVASTIGTVGGSLASAIPAGSGILKLPGMTRLATMAAPEGAALATRGAALAGRTAASAGAAGLQGLVSNPGDIEGQVNPLQPEERAKQGALSASVAAPLHLTGEGVSTVGKYISDRLKNKASELAFRALGPSKRKVNQNRDEIKNIGREALDSGVIGWVPGSAEALEERASNAAQQTGKQLGDLTDKLASLENEAISSGISRKQLADNLREKLITDNPQGIPGIDQRNKTFNKMISEFENSGKKPVMNFSDLRQAKMNVQGTKDREGLINWNRLKNADIPIEEQFHRALASELREGEDAGADAIEKAYFGQSSNQIQNLKNKYGNLEAAEQIAGNKADAQRANQILGLRDAITGSAGASLGGYLGYQLGGHEGAKAGAVIGGGVGGLGSKIARDYGPQLSAKSADVLSRIIARTPGLVEKVRNNPTLIPAIANSLNQKEIEPTISQEELKKFIGQRNKSRGIAHE